MNQETTDLFHVTDAWKRSYPGASGAVLALDQVSNPPGHPALETRKAALETELRERYAGYDRQRLRALPVLEAYREYYRRFKKTYHVLLQLESVIAAERDIPSVSPLVETMFMAELENLLLTAAHDLDRVRPPILLDVAAGTETYTQLNGREARLKEEDMFMADQRGVISSILYGPDRRTQIAGDTRRVLYTVYAPAGIPREAVENHLDTLHRYSRLFSPDARILQRGVYLAQI